MSDLFPSRAAQLGIKPKVLRARTIKALTHHRSRLTELALPYAEIDNSVEGALSELLAAFDAFASHIEDTAIWLEEQPGS